MTEPKRETVRDVGEFGLIRKISGHFIYEPSSVVLGAGDDGAVYRATPGFDQVISTDTMVEGIHFTAKTMSAEDVGWKLCIANFSDMAAMGAVPKQLVISASLPDDLDAEWPVRCYDGVRAACRNYGVNLLGGDVTGSRQGIILTGTVVGEVPEGGAVTRSGAKEFDTVFLVGTVGDSAAGLDAISAKESAMFPQAVNRHRRPEALVTAAGILRKAGVHSLNDVTDGIAGEAREIAEASGVDLILDETWLPISEETRRAAARYGKNPVDYALCGGEDYALLGTMDPLAFKDVQEKVGAVAIGVVRSGQGEAFLERNGECVKICRGGYDHFKRN